MWPGPGTPGDWRSILLDQYSHDRNVEVLVEREDPDVTAPGTNSSPDAAQYVGKLAPFEKGADDNRRLGFEIHGFLNAPNDLDVYSFDAVAGREVWFDIDRTSHALDAVVELIDASGRVIARSDNSTAEEQGVKLIDPSGAELPFGTASVLSKSAFVSQDLWTTNPRDPGMRVILPGSPNTTNTYHVRVRSSNPSVGTMIHAGQTAGVYQLQLRLQELDEVPGSTIRYADIRFATNGIEVYGQPAHSPLLGEVRETTALNDLIANAQNLGNLLSHRSRDYSVAGELVDRDPTQQLSQPEVDWYRLELDWQSVQEEFGLADVIFDLDYADGLARPNTHIYVFTQAGVLVAASNDSDVMDDQPAPLGGSSITDLSRGSAGNKDAFIGPIDLPTGVYYVAVTTGSIPQDLTQTRTATPTNPLVRLEPIDSTVRIAEDHVESNGGSTALPPSTPKLTDSTFNIFLPAGNEIIEGETVTVVGYLGDVGVYEFDSDGVVAGENVAVPYLITDLDTVVAASLATAIGGSPPPDVTAVAAGNQVSLQDAGAPDLNVKYVGTSPQSKLFISTPTIVPWRLSDVTLYVSQDEGIAGQGLASLVTIDPFTGLLETIVGPLINPLLIPEDPTQPPEPPQPGDPVPVQINLGDIAMRQGTQPLVPGSTFQGSIVSGQIMSFTLGGDAPTDENSGNYLQIDWTTAAVTLLEDDNIETYDPDPAFVPPDPQTDPPTLPSPVRAGDPLNPLGVGVQINAMTFLEEAFSFGAQTGGLAVGTRAANLLDPTLAADVDEMENILYIFNPTTGLASSGAEGDRQMDQNIYSSDPMVNPDFPTAATQIRERAVLDLEEAGGSPGIITGLAVADGTVYAVSNAGDLFSIDSPTVVPATATYIATITDRRGRGVKFSGLTAGPPNVEGGRYLTTLFGIDENGMLHAFDIEGTPQPIFLDGQSSLQTDASSPTGLAFSTLDENLWHITDERRNDPGHGLEVPVTQTRREQRGRSHKQPELPLWDLQLESRSAKFRLPWRHHGSMVTNTFDLSEYGESDEPVLYFNYFLGTEGVDFDPDPDPDPAAPTPGTSPNVMRDSLRVFISDDSRTDRRGKWYLLATNNSRRGDGPLDDEFDDPDPLDDVVIEVQELFDNTDNWRQTRVDLSSFAASDRLRLRFDFSSAGEMSVGTVTPKIEGELLRAIDAYQLRDGQTFTIDGDVFEFDLGYTLSVPLGRDIPDGETVTITGGGASATFEFDSDGTVQENNIPVLVTSTVTAANVALALEQAILASPLGGSGVVTYRHTERVNLQGVESVTQGTAAGAEEPSVFLDGSPGVQVGEPVLVHMGMNSLAVTDALVTALADVLAGGAREAIKTNKDTIRLYGHVIADPGPLGVAHDLPGDTGPQSQGAWNISGWSAAGRTNYVGVLRAMDNVHQGAYIDDLIIGLTERGELVTGNDNQPATDFVVVRTAQGLDPDEIRKGTYQLEIRRGPEYTVPQDPLDPFDPARQQTQLPLTTYDTNDRLTQSSAWLARLDRISRRTRHSWWAMARWT